jgi:hypothetical protein
MRCRRVRQPPASFESIDHMQMGEQRRIDSLQLWLVPGFNANHRCHGIAERPLKARSKNSHPECRLRDGGHHKLSTEHRRAKIVQNRLRDPPPVSDNRPWMGNPSKSR